MRVAALLLLLSAAVASAPPAAAPAPEYVLAVEFPYYLYPRAQWERELVWLKTIGVPTVEFSIPWNWHQLQPGNFDFTGRTSPRRDLAGFIRILRRLGLRGWVRPLPPVPGWDNAAWPAITPDAAAERAWLKELGDLLATQTEAHGGPIAFVEGATLAIDAGPPPTPVTVVSANDPVALPRSRAAVASARGALLWTDVEDQIYPAGWEAGSTALLHKGAVGLTGDERPSTAPLRRQAALLRNWAALLPQLRPGKMPAVASGKLPPGVTAAELVSKAASAISLINRGTGAFHDDLRVFDPLSRHTMIVPAVTVPAGQSLWLPLDVSLGPGGLCRECTNFSAVEHIVYATAELQTVEFENGILALEFAAPTPAEVILQLAREPEGPYLAAGKPTKFDWDEKTLRARLPIPAGKAAGNRVRVGLAIEAPDTSAFFSEARRLMIGQKNVLSTVYSSPQVASRSRLRAPEGFAATSSEKSPNEIEYSLSVPADALHGDFAPLALEADGVPLGRARLQLFRPLSVRMTEALTLHFGAQTHLPVEPPTAPAETRAGSNLEIILRNNSTQIQNYRLEASGEGLEFLPARTEIAVGAVAERPVSFRVFGQDGATGLRDWQLHVTGGAEVDLPMRTLLLPRAGTVAWTADLDGDGLPEWVLESPQVRAVFSTRDGGRWMELTWKDTDTNFLPEDGALAQPGTAHIHAAGDALILEGNGWVRTVRLSGATLTLERTSELPRDALAPQTIGNVSLAIERPSPTRTVYTLQQAAR
ncbi:MAG: beta-galactosidase [Acidobacteriia bacterium]|nr:beta-galactosidase [Terriglobia bacterium]